MLRTSTKGILGLLLLSTSLSAQVKVVVPRREYPSEYKIPARLENLTSAPITVCVQLGLWSPNGTDTIEYTPSPFLVEQNDHDKWSVLLKGPDVGSNSQPVEVDTGQSMKFPFRLRVAGTMRLRLDYWIGSRPDMKCNVPRTDTKHSYSETFTLF